MAKKKTPSNALTTQPVLSSQPVAKKPVPPPRVTTTSSGGPVDWKALEAMTKAGLSSADIHKLAGTTPKPPAAAPKPAPTAPRPPAAPPNWQLPQTPTMNPGNYTPTYTGTPQQSAQDNVDLEYNNRIRALEWAAGSAARQAQQGMDTEREYGREVDPRLASIYGALGNSLEQNRQTNAGTYESAIDKIRGYYDEAGQANAGLNQDIMQRITDQAQRLGIEAGIPEGTRGLTEDFAFNQSMNNNAKAGRSANLAELAAQINALDVGRVGAAGREGAQQRATLQNEIARTLGNLGVANFEEQGDYRNQIQGLGQDKATALRQELARITGERSDDASEARQLALQEFLGLSGNARENAGYNRGIFTDDRNFGRSVMESDREFSRGNFESDRNFGLAERQFGADVTNANRDYNLQRQELAMRQQELEARYNATENPLEQIKIQAEIDKIRAQTDQINQKVGQGPTMNTKFPQGQIGVDQFFSQPSAYWGQGGPNTTFRGKFQDIVAQTLAHGANDVPIGAGKTITDPYQFALTLLDANKVGSKDAMRAALQIFFKGLK